jgi:hypothetical protein
MTYDDFGNLKMEIRTDERTAVRLKAFGIFMERGVHLVRRPHERSTTSSTRR